MHISGLSFSQMSFFSESIVSVTPLLKRGGINTFQKCYGNGGGHGGGGGGGGGGLKKFLGKGLMGKG